MRDRLSVLTMLWHRREYRAFLLIMVFLSLATSSTLPLVTLYLADSLLALRFSLGRLFGLGLAIATIEYLILSVNTALWQVYLTQALDALVVAAVFGLGLTYAQRLSPGQAGLASSAFGSAFGIATLLGNVIGGVGVGLLGIPHLFVIPLATSSLALATFIGLDCIAARHRGGLSQAYST